jgi:O-succinylbenzoic acid--CoA ligase
MSSGSSGINLYFPNEGIQLSSHEILKSEFKNQSDYFLSIRNILKWWHETTLPLEIQTSGSTGKPKKILFSRKQVQAGAELTIKHLDLQSGNSALLTIDPQYVGGRMMIIRSLIAGMNLICVPPVSNPFQYQFDVPIHFSAFVPLQISEILSDQNVRDRFKMIKNILIGGAPVSPSTWNMLVNMSTRIFATYGMTETLSHVALRENKAGNDFYQALSGINFTADDRGCLGIEAPHLQPEIIQTNDIIELIDAKTFRWVGRADFMINSGGVKLNPELVEAEIYAAMENFGLNSEIMVAGIPDEVLGEKMILIVASGSADKQELKEKFLALIKDIAGRFHRPKEIFIVVELPKNSGGKIDRKAALDLILNRQG